MGKTIDILSEMKIKEIWPPTRLSKHHLQDGETPKAGKKLLYAILETPYGQHFKELSNPLRLCEVKASPYAASYYELTNTQLSELKRRLSPTDGEGAAEEAG